MTQSTIQILSDDRKRHTSQAYGVTYGGKSQETGYHGSDSRLSATYQANFQITVPVDAVGNTAYVLPSYVYCNKYVVVEGGGGLPVGTITIEDLDGSDVRIVAADVALGAPSTADVAVTNVIDVEPVDQTIVVAITTAGTGYATLLLKCDIVQTAWK